MGRSKAGCRSRSKKGAHSKNKGFKKYCVSTKHRKKDIDQIQDDLKLVVTGKKKFEFDDEDLPGRGKFYVPETDRHFIDEHAMLAHKRSKIFKKRVKELKKEQYTQAEADAGAGIMKEEYVPVNNNKTMETE